MECFVFAVSLNDGHIFDIIFSDEFIMDIVGALECELFCIPLKSRFFLLHPLFLYGLRILSMSESKYVFGDVNICKWVQANHSVYDRVQRMY